MITLASAASITKAKIETLRPEWQPKVQAWYVRCAEAGLMPYIYEGFRTLARQNELFAQGRVTNGPVVTNAKGGQSFHNYGLAFDWVPLARDTKVQGLYAAQWDDNDAYARGAKIGMDFGFRALSWETPHLEDGTYLDWRALKEKFASDDKDATVP